jgi:ADP-heptose:LPS heptosyltransferase
MKPSDNELKHAIFFQNGAIGDFLMAIFLAEMLRKSGRVDHVTIVVPRNLQFLRGLIGAYSYISAIEVSRHGGWGPVLKMMRRPNLVIIQPTLGKILLRTKFLAWLISRSAGSELLGFQDKGPLCTKLYSKTLVYNTDQLYSENMQNILRMLGVPILVQVPDLKITPNFKRLYAHGLNGRPYIVFHPGASHPKRSFTVRAAREVIAHVLKGYRELSVVLSGSSGERKWIEEIRDTIQDQGRIINALGCSAEELAAFIQSARLFLGTDSGITHLACFLRVPVIVAAHCGTANWLPFYCPTATVLYRLEEEEVVHHSRKYLDAQRRGRLKPFGMVTIDAICGVLDECLDGCIGTAVDRSRDPSTICANLR